MSHRFDLHTHSDHSDGTYTPTEIVHFAARGHIDLLALTDHDCISGVRSAMAAGKAEGVRVIPGVEFDNEYHHELHILGLDVDMDHPVLNRAMEVARERRDKRNEIILSRLDQAGIEVRPFMRTGQTATTKLHIAHAIIAAGYATEVREAFMKYLRPGTPGYYTERRFTPEQVLEIIHRSDGVPVLAHPCHIRENLHGLVRELVNMGLWASKPTIRPTPPGRRSCTSPWPTSISCWRPAAATSTARTDPACPWAAPGGRAGSWTGPTRP